MQLSLGASLRPIVHAALALCALTLFLWATPQAAHATVYYVSPTGTGVSTSWQMPGAMQPTLTAAQSGDQVWAKYGVYTGNVTTTDGVTVYGHFAGTETNPGQRPLTNPRYISTLNGNGSGTVYTIPSAATAQNTLDGFTVQGGTNRGVYDPSGDQLIVANCTISGNSVTNNGYGGGLYTQGLTATISNSTFTGNSAINHQYQVNVYGGGVYIASSTTSIFNNCYFTGNSVKQDDYAGGFGGAIFSNGTTILNACTLSSNSASYQGGGVYAGGNAITIQQNCTFTSNTNGGVFAGANSNTISDCTFTSNSGRGVTVFGSNSSVISNCTFSSNTATNFGNGAGLYAGSINTTITGCAFDNNTATNNQYQNTEYGGGLYLESGTTTFVSGCSFSGNSATQTNYASGRGGGLAGYGTPYITNCTFIGNTAGVNDSPDEIDLENVGTPSAPALIADNLIYGSSTGSGKGIDLAINGGSTNFAYVVVSNNDIAHTNVAINIGTGSATGGAVSVANNIFYANNGAVNYNASATFVSSHNDLFGNTNTYQGVALDPSDLLVDPMFMRNPNFGASPVDYGDLHLMAGSPLINAGDDSYVNPGDTDLDGNPRIRGSHVDIGCYEAASVVPALRSITASPTSLTGGPYVYFTVALTSPATAATTVTLTSSNPAVLSVPASATIGSGYTSVKFHGASYPVTAVTVVTITATYNGVSKSVNVTVNPPGLYELTISPTSITGGGTANLETILNSKATVNATIALTSSNPSVLPVPASVAINTGYSTKTITLTSTAVTTATVVTITGTYNGVSASVNITINPISLASVTANPTTVQGGVANSSVTVALTTQAAATTTVSLSSSNPAVLSVPATATIGAGYQSKTVTATSHTVTTSTPVTITATYAGVSQTTTVTVTP